VYRITGRTFIYPSWKTTLGHALADAARSGLFAAGARVRVARISVAGEELFDCGEKVIPAIVEKHMPQQPVVSLVADLRPRRCS
jgi:hypothetical protein